MFLINSINHTLHNVNHCILDATEAGPGAPRDSLQVTFTPVEAAENKASLFWKESACLPFGLQAAAQHCPGEPSVMVSLLCVFGCPVGQALASVRPLGT